LADLEYLSLADVLLIAETAAGIAAEELARLPKSPPGGVCARGAFASYGGVDFYPDFVDKAAVLCSRIVRNHALRDGNKRTAFLALVEFVQRNGHRSDASEGDPDESVAMI
jgi:death-on-curing protein